MDSNVFLKRSLEDKIKFFNTKGIEKLRLSPFKVIYFHVLELFIKLFKQTIRIKAETFWRGEMFVCLPEIVSRGIYYNGFYQPEVTGPFIDYLSPGMTVLDIGAHFGYFTLLAAYLVGKKGQVHSFEPTPSSFMVLQSNTVDRKNIKINNWAVSCQEADMYFNDYGVKNSVYNSIYDANEALVISLKPTKIMIHAITIDKYIRDNTIRPDFIKIDAESAEYEIILGAKETIMQFHPILLIEVGYREERYLAMDFLINKGYVPYTLKERKIIERTEDVPAAGSNILFLNGDPIH